MRWSYLANVSPKRTERGPSSGWFCGRGSGMRIGSTQSAQALPPTGLVTIANAFTLEPILNGHRQACCCMVFFFNLSAVITFYINMSLL